MKNYAILLGSVALLCCNFAMAQAPFTGGSGDGYDMAEAMGTTLSASSSESLDWNVYPTSLRPGEPIYLEGLKRNGSVSLVDPAGKSVWETVLPLGTNSIPLPVIAKGNYLLVIKEDSHTFTQKIQVR